MIRIKRLFKSFKYAFSGMSKLIEKEQNFRIHMIVGIVVILFGIYFQLKQWEWVVVILMIALVLSFEILNTVFERLTDMLKPRVHQYVKEIKDVMSAAVLIAAFTSVVIGLIIFMPYLLGLN